MRLHRPFLLLALIVGVVSISVAAPTRSPTLPEFEQGLLDALKKVDSAPAAVSGLPVTGPEADIVMQHFITLMREETVQGITKELLRQYEGQPTEDLYIRWMRQYATNISAAFMHWSDADILRLMKSTLFQQLIDEKACVRSAAPGFKIKDMPLTNVPRSELTWYLGTLQRSYLDAISNKTPRPWPSDSQIENAMSHVVLSMPSSDRDRFFAGGARTASVQDRCASFRALATAAARTEGEDGEVVRRVQIVELIHATFRPSRPAKAAVSTLDGRFQPGTARLEYPLQAARAGIEGTTKIRISVDANGLATKVKIYESSFNKEKLTVDGEGEINSVELFEPVVVMYYRSGRFQQRFENGKAVPYVATVEHVWRLED